MNALQVFKTPNGKDVRVTTIQGEPHFVAKDVAERLGYRWQANVVGNVPNEWKGVNPINTLGGVQNLLCLSEPGLYFFLARSDKPAALPFQKWVAGEVIPAIRKTGSYSVKQKSERPLSAALVAELRKVYGTENAAARIDHLIGYTGGQVEKHGHAGKYDPNIIKAYNNSKTYIKAIEDGSPLDEVASAIENACDPLLTMSVKLSRIRANVEPKESPFVYEPTTEVTA